MHLSFPSKAQTGDDACAKVDQITVGSGNSRFKIKPATNSEDKAKLRALEGFRSTQ